MPSHHSSVFVDNWKLDDSSITTGRTNISKPFKLVFLGLVLPIDGVYVGEVGDVRFYHFDEQWSEHCLATDRVTTLHG